MVNNEGVRMHLIKWWAERLMEVREGEQMIGTN